MLVGRILSNRQDRQQDGNHKLLTFPKYEATKLDPDSFLFVFAVGCDGAPICGTTLLASFLNVGKRLPSSQETWLLFGTDAGDNDSLYISKLNIHCTIWF